MLKDRSSGLLAWLVGGGEVIFDESHLGVIQDGSITALAREYKLTSLMVVLALLAGLYVWKNSVSFVPRVAAGDVRPDRSAVSGRGSSEALANLLRMSIPRADVLSACWRQWLVHGQGGRPRPRSRPPGRVESRRRRGSQGNQAPRSRDGVPAHL